MDRVEKSLLTQLNHEGSVLKRRSMGFRTDRASWVRIECRGLERLDGQGWGLEATAVLGVVQGPHRRDVAVKRGVVPVACAHSVHIHDSS